MKPVWLRSIEFFVSRGKVPKSRRRAEWRAEILFHRIIERLNAGDIAIDCGANVGKFTAKMASTGATVYAFEPDPYAVEQLRDCVGHLSNVTILNQAVGAKDTHVKLYHAPGYRNAPERLSLSSSVYATKRNVSSDGGTPVEQIDLARFIGQLERPVKLLKLDIEGAEVPVLEKLLKTGLLDVIEHIFVETHERGIPELAERTMALRQQLADYPQEKINLNWR